MLWQDKNSSEISPAPKTILKTCKYWTFKCLEVSEWSEMVNISSLCRNINFSYLFGGFFFTFSLGFWAGWFETKFRREPNRLLTFEVLLSLRVSKRVKQLRIQCHACVPLLHPEKSSSWTPPTVLLQSHGLWNHIQVGPTPVQSKWDRSCFLSSFSNT